MVFPFKQLRRWASRKKTEDSRPSNNNSQTNRAPTSSAFSISSPIPPKPSAPSPIGENETRAYIAGNPLALTQLYHAQTFAAERARRVKTQARGPSRYSIRSKGRNATIALVTHPDDSAALDQLIAEMIEAEQRKRQLRLPPFSRDAGGFISLRELVGMEVNLTPSPNQSPRVSSAGSAILEDMVLGDDANPDYLPMNIPSDETGNIPVRMTPTNTRQEEGAEEAMGEHGRPPSRRGRPPSCLDSSSEYSDDDDEEGREEEERSDYHRSGPPDKTAEPQGFRSNSQAREINHWRLQGPIRPPNPDFPRVYANILQIPDRNPPRTLTHSSRSIEPRLSNESSRPRTIHPDIHEPPRSSLTVLPVYSFASPEGEARLSYIRKYLSLPADLPACDLLVYLLQLDSSVRLDAASSNPTLAARADDIDWNGIEAHVLMVRRGDTADDVMRRVWEFRMVAIFLEAKVSLFTWDSNAPVSAGELGDGGDGDDDDDSHDEELERKIAVALRRRGSILRDCDDEDEQGENLRQKFRIQFKKRAASRTVRRERSEFSRLRTWTPPGRSQLAEVQASEDLE